MLFVIHTLYIYSGIDRRTRSSSSCAVQVGSLPSQAPLEVELQQLNVLDLKFWQRPELLPKVSTELQVQYKRMALAAFLKCNTNGDSCIPSYLTYICQLRGDLLHTVKRCTF